MNDQRIVFNSSFPRAGSTLLQNILAQNPRFFCSPTSGVLHLLLAARSQYTNQASFKAQDADEMRAAFLGFCAGGIRGFYRSITDKPVCVDKQRAWFHYHDWLKAFCPEPKILVCIRDIRAVLSSMEKLFRKNRHKEDPRDTIDSSKMVTVGNRVNHWMNTNPVGFAFMRLMEASQTGVIKRLHVIRFEDLTSNPKATMQKVYAYLGEPLFDHDFDHVEQKTHENDSHFVFYGDHKIRERVEQVRPDYEEILGKGICDEIKAKNLGFYKMFYPELL